MSSSDRRRFLALILGLPLAGCGFTPSYGPGASASALLGRVRADDPSNRDAFAFVARIEERLGLPQADAWRLSYRISTRRIDLAITTEGSILRYNIVGTVSWSLNRGHAGQRQGRKFYRLCRHDLDHRGTHRRG
jgi:LPS-assembly lipoprotein